EAAAHMGPAAGERDRPSCPRRTAQAVVGGIAVDLENAGEVLQKSGRMLAATAGRVKVGDGGWIAATPGAIVTGQGPEVSRAGSSSPRVEHGRPRLIHEQLCGRQQMADEAIEHRPELKGSLANPIGQ